MSTRTPAASTTQLVHLMGPVDTNIAGRIHGGTVMKLADEAAGIAAIKHCGARVATVSLDRMTSLVPIRVGELVTFTATVGCAMPTSAGPSGSPSASRPRRAGRWRSRLSNRADAEP